MCKAAPLTDERAQNIVVGVGFHFANPIGQAGECCEIVDVEHDDQRIGRAIVGLRDRTETLLASSVPDLKLGDSGGVDGEGTYGEGTYFDAFAIHFDGFDEEIHADGRCLSRRKHVLTEPTDETGLADTGVADENDFEQVFVIIHEHVYRGGTRV